MPSHQVWFYMISNWHLSSKLISSSCIYKMRIQEKLFTLLETPELYSQPNSSLSQLHKNAQRLIFQFKSRSYLPKKKKKNLSPEVLFFSIKFSNLWNWFDLQIFPCSIMLLSKVIEMGESFKFILKWLIDLICLGFYLTQLKLGIQSEIRYIFWVFLCDLSLLTLLFFFFFFFNFFLMDTHSPILFLFYQVLQFFRLPMPL